MLRSVTLGVLVSILAAACALVEPPPPPPGTRAIQVEVQNERGQAELSVLTPAGPIPGAVQPALVPAGSKTNVTIHLPVTEEWAIAVNGQAQDILRRLDLRQECSGVRISLYADGGSSAEFSCSR